MIQERHGLSLIKFKGITTYPPTTIRKPMPKHEHFPYYFVVGFFKKW